MKEHEIPKTQSPCSKDSSSTNTAKKFNYGAAGKEQQQQQQQQYKLKGYPNPPEHANPDAATLREQWRFAIKQYSKWYSHAWGTAILAGLSFFALGWIVKGSNPLPSSTSSTSSDKDPPP